MGMNHTGWELARLLVTYVYDTEGSAIDIHHAVHRLWKEINFTEDWSRCAWFRSLSDEELHKIMTDDCFDPWRDGKLRLKELLTNGSWDR